MKQSEPFAVGIIGLGLVGMALAQRLLQAGHRVLGHDLRSDAAKSFQAAGGTWCADLQQLQACQILVLAVYQTADVEALMHSLYLEHSVQGRRLVIDCSTGEPERLVLLSAQLKPLGIDLIEAPLSGSSAQIAAGEATMLLGADPAVLSAHQELLHTLSPRRIHAGGVGMGARAKLATNLVLGLNRAALAEGMAFAQSQGISPEVFLSMVLDSPARSDAALVKGGKMVSGDFTPQSRIRQHLKDLDVMLASAATKDQGLPLTRQHAKLLQAAIAAGEGELDNAAIVLQMRREKPDPDTSHA
jgi:3-hydroxyisobutyrate dehydrogenase-like beta-hydroxyacid dehydrogenase